MIKISMDTYVSVKKGEIISVTEGWLNSKEDILGNTIKLLSSGGEINIPRGLMVNPPHNFDEPIIGRVVYVKHIASSGFGATLIFIEEGQVNEDFIFVKSGEINQGKSGFVKILKGVNSYIKICDSYIDDKILDLFYEANPEVKIVILTQNIKELTEIKKKVLELEKKRIFVKIRKLPSNSQEIHGRYFITESGAWSCDSSLKDIGISDTLILQIPDKTDLESNFDDRYTFSGKKI